MGPSGRFTHVMIYWIVWDRFIQVLYLGRALRTKETLPDFLKWRRVTRHPLVFRGLTAVNGPPGLGASHFRSNHNITYIQKRKSCQNHIHHIHTIKHGIIDFYENTSGSDTTVGLRAEYPI